ncbi:MAG: peptidyl-tRNA hydrolase, PTH1 family [Candidatus Berkelbacteria bacterium Licking1014_7]|uniref:Peptidyl-tRNA hydrolase n=1 Tax=Candidatus Berkelbacteria bacterium Licking1014_7 TaxID=2017147 RepID=A0A554LHR5_9BACT|nr:MAG: peptidyl-tRNA hydrolase, PTH1 family [Candidatus Berkelbacteria bacterium Licking1014_7]
MSHKFLLVGLGNPGKKYEKTRHNAGRIILDCLKRTWLKDKGFQDDKIIFFTPESFMNETGAPVALMMRKNGIQPQNLIIFHDDLDISAGEFRIQKNRSSAGHKGVQSIIETLGARDFWRVRIGIGRPLPTESPEKYVLKVLSKKICEKICAFGQSQEFAQKIKKIIINKQYNEDHQN